MTPDCFWKTLRLCVLLVLPLHACGPALNARSDAGGNGGGGAAAGGGAADGYATDMLNAHNQVRADAMPAPVPALNPFTWDTSVASAADAWAKNCVFQHNSGRGDLGENIYASAQPATPANVVTSWASEAAGYTYSTDSCSMVCGHYTQIVWRNTTSIGCASARCTDNSPLGTSPWYFTVCDYSPPGNYAGQKPY